ncbi:MAG TPA: UDP-N-acetylglucosamine 2-epimerase, partial [Rubrivivax sp.]|nr:UDP-N-acetylglucosamine 2-epimerase [Rubrivivax sp.]
LSRWLFAPTAAAVDHLRREGIDAGTVHLVGDVMYDAALHFAATAALRVRRPAVFAALAGAPYVLATVHRAENTDDASRLDAIVGALQSLACEIPVVWPLHPRTRRTLDLRGANLQGRGRLHVVEPLGYLDMLELERAAALVVTDSGGVQKEAFFFERPCVTVRDETEWVELVEAGWNTIVPPTSSAVVVDACRAAIGSRGRAIQPYGKGDAAMRIARILRAAAGASG